MADVVADMRLSARTEREQFVECIERTKSSPEVNPFECYDRQQLFYPPEA